MDRNWLLGDPGWWKNSDEKPPDFRAGELSPPLPWASTTPSVGNFGWCRQRMRPLVWPLLRPLAWAPLFLFLSAIPLAIPGRTPNDQITSMFFFSISWRLVFLPILFSRNAQPQSKGSLLSLPVDWVSLVLASAIFPFHLSIQYTSLLNRLLSLGSTLKHYVVLYRHLLNYITPNFFSY